MTENRRRRSRVRTHFEATFSGVSGRTVELVTENVSLKGLLAEPTPHIGTGELGKVVITLASDARIETECRVIRSDGLGVAIEFLPMDAESFLHLRNLVRYNAPDADLIDEELTQQHA